MICTFFGHRECPEEIYPKLYDAIETLIRQKGVRCFYVGNQGRFDDHLFEGRYAPTNAQGKREVHTVYAKTREEVEPLLERMIAEVREQIKAEKRQMKTAAGGSPSASV